MKLKPIFILILLISSFYYYKSNENKYKHIDHTFIKTENYETKANEGFFKELSRERGILHKHGIRSMHKSLSHVENMVHQGASLSVVDINNDGYMDLYFTQGTENGKNYLYINNKKGYFEDKGSDYNLDYINEEYPTSYSAFFDCDNDGMQDMVRLNSYCLEIFKNTNNKFSKLNQEHIKDKKELCNGALTAFNSYDFNGDGLLDIVYGGFRKTDVFNSSDVKNLFPSNWYSSGNDANLIFLENQGSCQFKNISDRYKKALDSMPDNAKGWYHAISVLDINRDNREDLWLATDFGPDTILYGNGEGTFSREANMDPPQFSRNGMSATTVNLYDKESNKNQHYVFSSQVFRKGHKVSGNLFWKYNDKGKNIEEISIKSGLRFCGWSWGSQFVDYDNDADKDLLVTNGFVSSKYKEDGYWYSLAILDMTSSDVLSDASKWPDARRYSLSGYQESCLYENDGDNKFHEVTHFTEIKEKLADGRGVAKIDILNNGKVSLAISNSKNRPYLYVNEHDSDYNWIGFELEGKTINRDAIGAKIVILMKDGRVFEDEVRPYNSYSAQIDPRLHIGLRDYTIRDISGVMVEWDYDKKENISIDKLSINEYNLIVESYGE